MHKSLARIAKPVFVLSLVGCLLGLPGEARAEAIIGCPLGLRQGELWLRTGVMYVNANEAYMAEDTASDPEMMPLNDSTHMQKLAAKIRIGYGITDWLDVGVATEYLVKDMEFYGYQRSPASGAIAWKHKIVDASGFADVWFSGKVKLLGHHSLLHPSEDGWLEGLALGIAYKAPTAGDDQVTRGIGSSTNDIKAGLLVHNKLFGDFHLCSHLTYQYVGKVREVYMRNHMTGGPYPGTSEVKLWPKSGWDLGDKITYKANFEYELGKYFEIAVGAIGWMQAEHADSTGAIKEDTDRHQHSIVPKLVFFPLGGEHEHSKIIIGVNIPYKYKTNFRAPFIPMLTAMWTF